MFLTSRLTASRFIRRFTTSTSPFRCLIADSSAFNARPICFLSITRYSHSSFSHFRLCSIRHPSPNRFSCLFKIFPTWLSCFPVMILINFCISILLKAWTSYYLRWFL